MDLFYGTWIKHKEIEECVQYLAMPYSINKLKIREKYLKVIFLFLNLARWSVPHCANATVN